MNDTDMILDQILAIGGLGSGPYGGGDVVRWSPDGQELLVAAAIGGELGLWLIPRAGALCGARRALGRPRGRQHRGERRRRAGARYRSGLLRLPLRPHVWLTACRA